MLFQSQGDKSCAKFVSRNLLRTHVAVAILDSFSVAFF